MEDKIAFENPFIDYQKVFSPSTRLLYKGPFDKHMLYVIGNIIRQKLFEDQELNKRVFSIFIELAQNISYYADESIHVDPGLDSGIGAIIIEELDGSYYFNARNLVKETNLIHIMDKCQAINTLDRHGLRDFRRQYLRRKRSIKGGANIGLIQVALITSNPLDIEIVPHKEGYSIFSITVKIDK